jgi:hypothetical protein
MVASNESWNHLTSIFRLHLGLATVLACLPKTDTKLVMVFVCLNLIFMIRRISEIQQLGEQTKSHGGNVFTRWGCRATVLAMQVTSIVLLAGTFMILVDHVISVKFDYHDLSCWKGYFTPEEHSGRIDLLSQVVVKLQLNQNP